MGCQVALSRARQACRPVIGTMFALNPMVSRSHLGRTLNEYLTRRTPAYDGVAAEFRCTCHPKKRPPDKNSISLSLIDTNGMRIAREWSCTRERASHWA